jgi:O-antigen/teichoic acid export membrane protein
MLSQIEAAPPATRMLHGLVRRIAHGRGRNSAVLRTALASLLTRGFSILASLLTVPIVLHHLGTERYGIWMAAIALTTLFALADGGVTNGLIALVSRAYGAGDRTRIRVLIGSALAATLAFVSAFLVAVLIVVHFVNWTWAFNLSDPALGGQAAAVVLIICLSYALATPATVVSWARLGLLQGAAVNIWDFCGTVLAFVGLVTAAFLGYGLVTIAAIWAAGPALARSLGALMFLIGPGRDLTPSWRDVNTSACRTLVASGGIFMIYALCQALSVQSDQILVARFLGADAVANYSVVQRLFSQPQVLVALVLVAQWPAYGEALGRGDHAWIRRHFRHSLMALTGFAAIVCLLLGIFCRDILAFWVGGSIVAPPPLVAAMAVYGVAATTASAFSFFFFSLGLLRSLLFTQIAMVAIKLPLSIALIPLVGSAGAVIGTTVGYVFALIIPSFFMLRPILADSREPLSKGLATRLGVEMPAKAAAGPGEVL